MTDESGGHLERRHSTAPDAPPHDAPARVEDEPIGRPLTEEERSRVAQIRESVDPTDPQAVIEYGLPAQSKIASFADQLLGDIRAKDADEAGEALGELLLKVRQLNVDALAEGETGSRIPIVGRFIDRFRGFDKRYEKISSTVERLLTGLERTRMGLLRDITVLDKMYDLNLEHLAQLDLYILAGEDILQQLRTETIPAAEEGAGTASDGLAAQELADMRQAAQRFERRVHDLKLTRTIAIQTAPQIRLIQGNDQSLVEKIQSSMTNTIPLWKNQISIALSLYRQRRALQVQKAVTDASNEMLSRNAEMLRTGSAAVARESERAIVDVETLRKVNDDLIATLEEGIQIQEEGRARRLATEAELIKLQTDLKRKLIRLKK